MSTLSFKSPAGTSYTVNIGKGSYTLIGSPEPFVIQEDDDTNAFLPIRKTTGYVRFIVNDSSQWENLIPTSATDVTVQCSDCHFFGFALPQSYGGSFAYGPSEFSLAIGCPLCALASMKLNYDDNTSNNEVSGLISFSDLFTLLVKGFDQNLGIQIDYSAIGTYSGQNVSTLEVQWQLLFEDSEDGSTFKPKYNNLEILEKICTFFGVTARCIDNKIKLIKPDDHDIQPISVADFLLADTDSTIEIDQGVGLVKTRAQVSDSATFEFGLDRVIEKVMNEPNLYALALPGSPTTGQNSIKYYLSTSQFGTSATPADAVVPDVYEFNDVKFNFHNGLNQKLYLFANEDKRYKESSIDVYNKSWRGLLRHEQISDQNIDHVRDFTNSSCFNCKKKYYFSGGYFKLSGRCFNFNWDDSTTDYQEETPGVFVCVILKVGDQYFNGQDFQSGFAVFPVWTKDGMLGKGYYERVPGIIPTGFHFDQDYIIPVKGNLEGKVSLGIGPVLNAAGKPQVFFENISLEYHRDRGYRNQTSKTYPQEGGSFSNTIEFDSFFASDSERLKYGLELIVKSGGGFYGSDNTEVPIEQQTAARIAQFGTTSKRVLTLNLREGDALYGKEAPYWIYYGGLTYYAISISQNPAKGVYTVKLI